ncbi:MAG: Flp pilus assembly complex ATPase component TadA, partial [Planctomycetes bacterium]|nr:Flp pilus assembly complex ATPase component TadA [Planctomycetota bacterium]
MGKFDKKLHAVLVKRGAVDAGVADQALTDAQANGKGFCDLLLERKAILENDLIGCVAQEMNLAPIDLRRFEADPDVLEDLPQDLAKYYGVVPIAKVGKILTVAVANPFDIVKLDDIEIVTGCELRPVVSSEATIRATIDRIYNPGEKEMTDLFDKMSGAEVELKEKPEEEQVDLTAITSDDDSSPVIKLVNLIIYQAIQKKASDIHVEPFEKVLRVRYRQDGELSEAMTPPKKMQGAISSRIKIMADLDIAEHNRTQDGKFQLKVDGRQIDFRVSILPTVHGEKVVMRILDSTNITLGLEQLGFEDKALSDFKWALSQPYGMVLVTGPTGSGKSTTLYSALKEVMTDSENIVTVEDPVEYQLHGVNQVPVNPKRGLTFAAALRAILRQDPDTIMIGEIRDQETIDIAIKAALTGHLVLSTLHTNDAPGTISRMVDMGVDP